MSQATVVNRSTHHFTIDKSIIYDLIFQQAGSLHKGLMKLVMNEIDARAGEVRISVSPDMQTITVEGDGVGFTSESDILKLFRCFGFDHETEEEADRNREFGRYGLGRAQIFAFGSSRWLTNQFEMQVDLKDTSKQQSLPFELIEHGDEQYRGCKVELSLYKTMTIFQRNELEKELKETLRYTRQPVYLNGALINKPMQKVKWNKSDEHFGFIAASEGSSRGLRVYNKGVFVRDYSHSTFGVSGDLVSLNRTFDVNMARNDVQQATCTLWPMVNAFIKEFVEKRAARKKMTQSDRDYHLQQMLAGQADLKAIGQQGLLTLTSGRFIGLSRLRSHANGKITMCPPEKSRVGEKVHNSKLAATLCEDGVKELGFDSLQAFVDALISALDLQIKTLQEGGGTWRNIPHELYNTLHTLRSLDVVDFSGLADQFDDEHEIIPKKDYSKHDVAKMHGLEPLNALASHITGQAPRNLLIGRCETASAWTNGRDYVALEIEEVRKAYTKGMSSLLQLLMTLIHEYCHDASSSGAHAHDDDFNARFRDALESPSFDTNETVIRCYEMYFRKRSKLGLGTVSREVRNAFTGFETRLARAVNGN